MQNASIQANIPLRRFFLMGRQEIEDWRPDLVIIDTLSAYMGSGRDMHRQNEVGEFLAELTEMAKSAECGVLAIAHLNKQSGEQPNIPGCRIDRVRSEHSLGIVFGKRP